MNQINELTNDQLIAIITCSLPTNAELLSAANEELLKRIKGNKQTIDSLFDMAIIRKDTDEVKARVNDLHERCDQVIKKMLELEALSRPLGILTTEGKDIKFTPMGPEKAQNMQPQLGDPYIVDVGYDYTVFRNGVVINWSNPDMIHFAMLCVDVFCKERNVQYDVELKKYAEKHAKNH